MRAASESFEFQQPDGSAVGVENGDFERQFDLVIADEVHDKLF